MKSFYFSSEAKQYYYFLRCQFFHYDFLLLSTHCKIPDRSKSPRRSSVPQDESSSRQLPSASEPGPCRIGLAALQQKALKQQEQLSRTALGFRFPVDVSPTSSSNVSQTNFFESPHQQPHQSRDREQRRRV